MEFRSVIVVADKVEQARAVLGGGFDVGIGDVWDAPATHYIHAAELEPAVIAELEKFCTVTDKAPLEAMGTMQQVRPVGA